MLSYRRAVLTVITVLALYLVLSHLSSSTQDESQQGTYTHWSSRSSRPLTPLSQKPLRSQLAYHFPYRPTSKFPAYIWQTWRTAPSSKDFPSAWRTLEASWTEKNPGFIHEVITDDAAVPFLRHLYSAIPDVVEAYNALPYAVLQADFFRYLVLLARGGIYSDIDTYALKPATAWIPQNVPRESYGLVIGIEADPDREDWEKWYSRRIQFCQWTIQAKPGHPVLREVVSRITEKTLALKNDGRLKRYSLKRTVEFTGPSIWTDVLFSYFNDPNYFSIPDTPPPSYASTSAPSSSSSILKNVTENVTWRNFTGIKTQHQVGDVVVLPITSFSPGVGQMGSGPDNDTMAFVKHFFEGSWKSSRDRRIGKKEWQVVIPG